MEDKDRLIEIQEATDLGDHQMVTMEELHQEVVEAMTLPEEMARRERHLQSLDRLEELLKVTRLNRPKKDDE